MSLTVGNAENGSGTRKVCVDNWIIGRCKVWAKSVVPGSGDRFFKMISGEVEKLRIYAILIHGSGLSC